VICTSSRDRFRAYFIEEFYHLSGTKHVVRNGTLASC
jgi:hypothetical protein